MWVNSNNSGSVKWRKLIQIYLIHFLKNTKLMKFWFDFIRVSTMFKFKELKEQNCCFSYPDQFFFKQGKHFIYFYKIQTFLQKLWNF